jgi:acyl-CoA thioesterase
MPLVRDSRLFGTAAIGAHPFDEAVALKPAEEKCTWHANVHPAYANMVGPFGGISIAQAMNSIMIDTRRQGEPTSMTLNFVAPIKAAPFKIITCLKRTSRSTQHWTADFIQDGEVVALAMMMCAVRRDNFEHLEASMPVAPAPESLSRSNARFPTWVSRYDMRFVEGAPRLAPTSDPPAEPVPIGSSNTVLWFKDSPDRPLDFQSLAAACDVFYPRIYIARPVFCPAGTVSITTYFHATEDTLRAAGSDFLLGEARAAVFHRGYADQTARLWTRNGRLLATSAQSVYFKP